MSNLQSDNMHPKRRRRTRSILQKKEELVDSSEKDYTHHSHNYKDDEYENAVSDCTCDCYSGNNCGNCYNFNNKETLLDLAQQIFVQGRGTLLWCGYNEEKSHQTWRTRKPRSYYNTITKSIMNLSTLNVFLLGIFLSIFISNVQGQPPPLPPAGFLDFDNLPVTRFSCEGKVIGGYYADVETGCQMFHVCTLGQKDEVQDIKFLCLNGTVFDQETRVCERVDEVDCSKAEQYFDLNLDLYVPHVATPKPPDADLEEEDDFIRPVSTPRPPTSTTTVRTTTTTRATTTTTRATTTTTSPRTRPPQQPSSPSSTKSPPTKGYSSFNYYLKTPHSHVASGYNSQSRQSYIFNHNPTGDQSEKDGSYSVNENTGRKIPSGPKTIVYQGLSSQQSSTAKPGSSSNRNLVSSRVQVTTTTVPILKQDELDEQYADEYYDDELPLDYEVSSSTSGSQQTNSKQANSYENSSGNENNNNINNNNNNNNNFQKRPSSYDYRDGRSTTSSKGSSTSNNDNRGTKSETKSHISVAVSSSKSTSSPPVISRTIAPVKPKIVAPPVAISNSTEEPYYYDDDYPEDERDESPLPAIIVRGTSSSTTRSTAPLTKNEQRSSISISSSTGKSDTSSAARAGPSPSAAPRRAESTIEPPEGDNAEYYDDGSDTAVNVNDHHFTHVDVPRIPFAKPNVPRVLVTNGKPFLPRLRRQSHHHFVPMSKQELQQHIVSPPPASIWESLVSDDDDLDSNHYQTHRIISSTSSRSSSSRSKRSLSSNKASSKSKAISSTEILWSNLSTDLENGNKKR